MVTLSASIDLEIRGKDLAEVYFPRIIDCIITPDLQGLYVISYDQLSDSPAKLDHFVIPSGKLLREIFEFTGGPISSSEIFSDNVSFLYSQDIESLYGDVYGVDYYSYKFDLRNENVIEVAHWELSVEFHFQKAVFNHEGDNMITIQKDYLICSWDSSKKTIVTNYSPIKINEISLGSENGWVYAYNNESIFRIRYKDLTN